MQVLIGQRAGTSNHIHIPLLIPLLEEDDENMFR
jgi:hypothetical protein